jgi:xyloglucan-specific endo-beta-1,4-glucanase
MRNDDGQRTTYLSETYPITNITMFAFPFLLPLLGFTLASPLSPSATAVDTATHCGQWDQVTSGTYTLFLNQWGASGATSGSQCAQVMSQSGNEIAWMTNWTWTGGNGVKSYTNVQQNNGVGKTLAQIKSIPVSCL